MKSALIALSLTLTVAGGARAADAPDEARIESGRLRGVIAGDVAAFKGIPFAAPPVGDLRWRAPQPAAAWSGVRDATTYGHDCMQKPFPSDAAPLGTEPAEDCLVLNVWRPAKPSSAKLPVMVWIYGGGFVNGGSSPAVYDGSAFAKRGVVMVSFNYRVGRFGFFAHPALTAANADGGLLGNYALLDQLAALKWVQRNIAAFGGDPANVTLVGESAGGSSVHDLMTMPMATGLFAKAIVESGGGRNQFPPRLLHDEAPGAPPSAEAVGVAFAKSAGIQGEDAAALAALRALPADAVVAGLNMATPSRGTYSGPMIDGKILTAPVSTLYAEGKALPGIAMMVGANGMDGFAFAKTMDEVYAPLGADKRAAAQAIYDRSNSGDVRAVGAKVAADRMMGEPARFVAKTLTAQGHTVYEFRFSYVAESMRKEWPGAPHASEIPFVFDTVKARYGAALTPKDEAVAQLTNAYWVAFAKSGDPNGDGRPVWPVYSATGDDILDIGDETVGGPDSLKPRLDLVEQVNGKSP
jgi:para-nitrobenzyl esterase